MPPKTIGSKRRSTFVKELRSDASLLGVTSPGNATVRLIDAWIPVPYAHELISAKIISPDIDTVGTHTSGVFRITPATAASETAGNGTAVTSSKALAESTEKLSVNEYVLQDSVKRGAANDAYMIDATGSNAGDLHGRCILVLEVLPIPRPGL